MIRTKRVNIKNDGSCSCCSIGELTEDGKGLSYPYTEVTSVRFGEMHGTVVRLCDDCFNELKTAVTKEQ